MVSEYYPSIMIKAFFKIQYCVFLILISWSTAAQVLSIDREIQSDSIKNKWLHSVDFSLSSDKLKKNLLDVNSRIETTRFFTNDYVLVGSVNNELTLNGNDVLQNEGYVQLRYRDNDKRQWSDESYVQYQWNDALGMEYRQVLGSNLRMRIFDKKSIDLYSGLGVFYEKERWNWSGVDDVVLSTNPNILNRELYRLNHYWKFACALNENLDISAVSYFQFPLNGDFTNMRWYWDLKTNLKISKKTSFVIHYDHTFDKYRLVPIAKFYYSIDFGVQVKW